MILFSKGSILDYGNFYNTYFLEATHVLLKKINIKLT